MRQRILGSHTPPCHRRMVITTQFNVLPCCTAAQTSSVPLQVAFDCALAICTSGSRGGWVGGVGAPPPPPPPLVLGCSKEPWLGPPATQWWPWRSFPHRRPAPPRRLDQARSVPARVGAGVGGGAYGDVRVCGWIPGREENCSAGGGGDTEAHFPNPPPPSLAAVTGGGVRGGGARPAVPRGGGGQPNVYGSK